MLVTYAAQNVYLKPELKMLRLKYLSLVLAQFLSINTTRGIAIGVDSNYISTQHGIDDKTYDI